MRWMKWIGLVAAVVLIVACFLPWVVITVGPGKVIVSGIDSEGTNFGKPGYFHFAATFFFLLFTFIPVIWAKRFNLAVAAINLAWAIRNYFIITMCRGGECPEKYPAIYLVLAASLFMLVSALLPDNKAVRKTTAP
jgi:hypothetical protein